MISSKISGRQTDTPESVNLFLRALTGAAPDVILYLCSLLTSPGGTAREASCGAKTTPSSKSSSNQSASTNSEIRQSSGLTHRTFK